MCNKVAIPIFTLHFRNSLCCTRAFWNFETTWKNIFNLRMSIHLKRINENLRTSMPSVAWSSAPWKIRIAFWPVSNNFDNSTFPTSTSTERDDVYRHDSLHGMSTEIERIANNHPTLIRHSTIRTLKHIITGNRPGETRQQVHKILLPLIQLYFCKI
jgi:hypothetical protein